MTETEIKITIRQDGKVVTEMGAGTGKTSENGCGNESRAAAGETMTEAEAERYAIASDLANVCEYLEESEVIKIRLIVSKAQARRERAENGG